MRRALRAIIFLTLAGAMVTAQPAPARPVFPQVRVGFDDGREALIKEIVGINLDVERLFERVFADWHAADFGRFAARHLTGEERSRLDRDLKLEGALVAATAETACAQALAKTKPATIATALGRMLAARGYTAVEGAAWLYARDLNCFVQRIHAGNETLHAFSTRRTLRELAAAARSMTEIFDLGLWQFDCRDGRLARGGHYDGPQLVESLTHAGLGKDFWALALKKVVKDLPPEVSVLVDWGDPVLLARALDGRLSESDIAAAAREYFRKTPGSEAPLLDAGLLRIACTTRWLRTAGPGVKAVYHGPMPQNDAGPALETLDALSDADDMAAFAKALSEPLRRHFAQKADWLTLVLYDDGGARAMLTLAEGGGFEYGADSPLGAGKHQRLLFEGRASASAKAGAFSLVFGPTAAPRQRLDLSDLVEVADGALIWARLEDGKAMRPILLKRTSALVSLD